MSLKVGPLAMHLVFVLDVHFTYAPSQTYIIHFEDQVNYFSD